MHELTKVNLPTMCEQRTNKNPYYNVSIDNLFFKQMVNYYEESSLHKSIIDNKIQRIVGSNLIGDDELSTNLIPPPGPSVYAPSATPGPPPCHPRPPLFHP